MASVAELANLEKIYYGHDAHADRINPRKIVPNIPHRAHPDRYTEVQPVGTELVHLAAQIDARVQADDHDLGLPHLLLHTSRLVHSATPPKQSQTVVKDEIVSLWRSPEGKFVYRWVKAECSTLWWTDDLYDQRSYQRHTQARNSGSGMGIVLDPNYPEAPIQQLQNDWIEDDGLNQFTIWNFDLETIKRLPDFLFHGFSKGDIRQGSGLLEEVSPEAPDTRRQPFWRSNARAQVRNPKEQLWGIVHAVEERLNKGGFAFDGFPEPLWHSLQRGSYEFIPQPTGQWSAVMEQTDASVFLVNLEQPVFFLIEYPHEVEVKTLPKDSFHERVVVYEHRTQDPPVSVTAITLPDPDGGPIDYFTGGVVSQSSVERLCSVLQGEHPHHTIFLSDEVNFGSGADSIRPITGLP